MADLGYTIGAYTPAAFPIDNWKSEWAFVHDSRPVVGALQAFAASIEWSFETPEYMAEADANGIVPVIPGAHVVPNYHLICTEPVTSLADAQGLRARTGGPTWEAIATGLGMTPVNLAAGEIYEGFQRGVVDCFVGNYGDTMGLGVWEVAKHATEANLTGWSSYHIAFGRPYWDRLDAAGKEIVWQETRAYLKTLLEQSLEQHRLYAVEGVTQGTTFHQIEPDLAEAIAAQQQDVLATTIDRAPAGVSDPEVTLQRYLDLHEKWLDSVLELGYEPEEQNWTDWANAQGDSVSIDLDPFVDLMMEEIYEVREPLE